MPNTKLSDILKRLMFVKSIRPMELARVTNLPQPTVQRIVTGTSPNPHLSSLLPIADYFGVTIDQLKGEEPIPEFDPPKAIPEGMWQIPVISWHMATIWPELQTGYKQTNKSLWVEDKISAQAFALVLPDASMFPIFPKGTLVIIDPEKTPKDRSYVLVILKNHTEAIFRQLLIDASQQYLKSLSPDLDHFPMLHLTPEDRISGVLVQARKDFEE